MPGGSRHAPKPRGAAEGGRSSQTAPRQNVKAGGASVDEARIADVIRPVIAAAGLDLESVRVTAAGRRRLLRVVVDSDRGVSLDDAAAITGRMTSAIRASSTEARPASPAAAFTVPLTGRRGAVWEDRPSSAAPRGFGA